MSGRWMSLARYLGFAAVGLGYALLAHYATVAAEGNGALALLSVGLFAAVFVGIAWHSPHRHLILVLGAIGAGLVWLAWSDQWWQQVGWIYFLQHAGTNAALGLFFGRTLLHQRDPLCGRIAAAIYGELSPRHARYTRQVTIAWTLFFGINAAASAILFFFAPAQVWSAFANILYLPLLLAMFVIEYAVRRRVLPEEQHSFFDAIKIFRKNFGTVPSGS